METAMSDFDFIFGDWDVAHRKLKARHVGSDDWDTFASTSRCEPRLGGVGNVEEVCCPDRGWSGMALRLFDPEQQLWSIWWADSRDGRLQPPVSGRFVDGRGVFEGDDENQGRPIRARFIWTVDDRAPRWEQAFSLDGGATWETNWIMDFSRRAA
jgi:hypothetical protein